MTWVGVFFSAAVLAGLAVLYVAVISEAARQ